MCENRQYIRLYEKQTIWLGENIYYGNVKIDNTVLWKQTEYL